MKKKRVIILVHTANPSNLALELHCMHYCKMLSSHLEVAVKACMECSPFFLIWSCMYMMSVLTLYIKNDMDNKLIKVHRNKQPTVVYAANRKCEQECSMKPYA